MPGSADGKMRMEGGRVVDADGSVWGGWECMGWMGWMGVFLEATGVGPMLSVMGVVEVLGERISRRWDGGGMGQRVGSLVGEVLRDGGMDGSMVYGWRR